MILVNGIEDGTIGARDRGLAYGDGVFRTLRLHNGKPLHWQRQYAKLAADSAAVSINCPAAPAFEADLARIAAAHASGVIRITVTRGIAARGYAIDKGAAVTRVVTWQDLPPHAAADYGDVRVRWCRLRLAIQPALAGIKHLNRLENVLARAEWHDPQIAEGLLRDTSGNVIGGTMSNLLVLRDGQLSTPDLSGAGIAGVTRDLIIAGARAAAIPVTIKKVRADEVHAADAVFLVNSVIGVWQIRTLEEITWGGSPLTALMRNWIADGENA